MTYILLIKEIKVPSQYVGIVYSEPNFKGETQWLIEGRCRNLIGSFDATVSSYKIQAGNGRVGRCTFYDSLDCTSTTILTPNDGLNVSSLGDEDDNKARSYQCSLDYVTIDG